MVAKVSKLGTSPSSPGGIVCIEHLTILLLFVVLFTVTYLYYTNSVMIRQPKHSVVVPFSSSSSAFDASSYPMVSSSKTPPVVFVTPQPTPSDVITVSSSNRSIYTPPLKMDLGMSRMVPMETRPSSTGFSQVGILSRGNNDHILPLMGRRLGRDRFNYYTMSTNGTINTKLPLRVNGRSGTAEYGCDELSSGDGVLVTGYNDRFLVTMYENGMYVY